VWSGITTRCTLGCSPKRKHKNQKPTILTSTNEKRAPSSLTVKFFRHIHKAQKTPTRRFFCFMDERCACDVKKRSGVDLVGFSVLPCRGWRVDINRGGRIVFYGTVTAKRAHVRAGPREKQWNRWNSGTVEQWNKYTKTIVLQGFWLFHQLVMRWNRILVPPLVPPVPLVFSHTGACAREGKPVFSCPVPGAVDLALSVCIIHT
jgi:hypothetical protein